MTLLGRSIQDAQARLEGKDVVIRYVHTPWITRGVWRIIKEEIKDGAVCLTASLFKEAQEAARGDGDD